MLEIILVPTWCPDTEIWLQLFYIVNQSNALELIHVKKIQFKYNLTFIFSKTDIFLHIVQLLKLQFSLHTTIVHVPGLQGFHDDGHSGL